MGFLKDFKDDFSQAMNELVPGEDLLEEKEEDNSLEVDTLKSEVDVESELSKIDGLLEQVSLQTSKQPSPISMERFQTEMPTVEPVKIEKTKRAAQEKTKHSEQEKAQNVEKETDTKKVVEERKMTENAAPVYNEMRTATEEVAVITEGTIIKGDIITSGSLDIRGHVQGNIECSGKLVVTGVVTGNSTSSEFFADAAKIEGEVVSSGTVKIGIGSVIIGNITSASAAVAGAIKGDIDVQGPVVVDTSAVVMGNIKSRSVQINNGAVIEGFCSQCYSDVNMEELFGTTKGE